MRTKHTRARTPYTCVEKERVRVLEKGGGVVTPHQSFSFLSFVSYLVKNKQPSFDIL